MLNFFKAKGCRTVGIEPTDAAKDSKHDTLQKYFDKNSANEFLQKYGNPDIITFTNVFAHINDLKNLLENLKMLLSDKTAVIIENHYLGAVLQTNQFDTFYHEHPRTYSQTSFHYISKTLGLELFDVQYVSRYGGNIRVFMGSNQTTVHQNARETEFINDFKKMKDHIENWKIKTKHWINDFVNQNGPMRAKAFPGRAAILIKLLELDVEHISAVYEIKGSIKVNHYVPGTRIPILQKKLCIN